MGPPWHPAGRPPSQAAGGSSTTTQAKSAVEDTQVVVAQPGSAAHGQPIGRDLPNTLQASPVGLHHREDLECGADGPGGPIRHHLFIEQPETLQGKAPAQFREIESPPSGLPVRALACHHALQEVEEPLSGCRCHIVRENCQSDGCHRRSRLPQNHRRPDVLFEADVARFLPRSPTRQPQQIPGQVFCRTGAPAQHALPVMPGDLRLDKPHSSHTLDGASEAHRHAWCCQNS